MTGKDELKDAHTLILQVTPERHLTRVGLGFVPQEALNPVQSELGGATIETGDRFPPKRVAFYFEIYHDDLS